MVPFHGGRGHDWEKLLDDFDLGVLHRVPHNFCSRKENTTVGKLNANSACYVQWTGHQTIRLDVLALLISQEGLQVLQYCMKLLKQSILLRLPDCVTFSPVSKAFCKYSGKTLQQAILHQRCQLWIFAIFCGLLTRMILMACSCIAEQGAQVKAKCLLDIGRAKTLLKIAQHSWYEKLSLKSGVWRNLVWSGRGLTKGEETLTTMKVLSKQDIWTNMKHRWFEKKYCYYGGCVFSWKKVYLLNTLLAIGLVILLTMVIISAHCAAVAYSTDFTF